MRIARSLRAQIGLERRKQRLLRPVPLIRLPDELQDAAHEGVVAGRRTGGWGRIGRPHAERLRE